MTAFGEVVPTKYPGSVLSSRFFRWVLILASILYPNVLNSHSLGRLPYQRKAGASLCAECTVVCYVFVMSSHFQHHSCSPRPWSIVPSCSIPRAVCMCHSTLLLDHEEYVHARSILI